LRVFDRKAIVLTNAVHGKKLERHTERGRKLLIREMKKTKVCMEVRAAK
jgi:hypothetical protein